MGIKPADHIGLRLDPSDTEIDGVIRFEALAQVGAQREVSVRIAVGQRDVFQVVQRLAFHARIGEHRPILLPTIEHDCRARRRIGYGRRSRQHKNAKTGRSPIHQGIGCRE